MISMCWSLPTFFSNLAQGITHLAHYVIKGKEYDTGYYLTDSIYPKWSTIVQTIHEPRGLKKKNILPCNKKHVEKT